MPSQPERVSTRPLLDKLGVKPGARVALVDLDDDAFRALLAERTEEVIEGIPTMTVDLAFVGADSVDALGLLPEIRKRLVSDGAIWVVSRKGKAATLRDVDVMQAAIANGLIDNKVVSFSESHTSLRLVIPRALRAAGARCGRSHR